MRKKVLKLFGVLVLLISVVFLNSSFLVQAEVTESRVLFVSNRIGGVDSSDSYNDIYIMNQDGSNVLRLTDNYFDDKAPCWSPDATQIVFESMRDGNYEIYLMNADGSNQSNLTNNPVYVDKEPAWGPKIVFTSNRNGLDEIYTIDPDGTDLVRLTTNGGNSQPAWSPDGQKIAYVSNGDIYVMNADGSGQTQLTNNPNENQWPAWSPDGSKIAYAANPDWDWEIYVMNADGSSQNNLTVSSVEDDTHPTWTQDGTKMYFQSHRDGNWDLYQMNSSDGGMQTRITKRSGDSFAPACFMEIATINHDTWESVTAMLTARTLFGAAAANGKIYVMGGYNNLSSVEEYNPGTNSWAYKAPMPAGRWGNISVELNGIIYTIGGLNANTIFAYNPSDNSWDTKAPMHYSRRFPAVAVEGGKIYAISGCDGGGSTVEAYDPSTNNWTILAPIPHWRYAAGAATVNGKIYVIAGTQDLVNPVDTISIVEEYDPGTNSWRTMASIPTNRYCFGIQAYQNKIYVLGGYINNTITKTDIVEIFDPASGGLGTWSTGTSMPTPRCGLCAVELGGTIYSIGGSLDNYANGPMTLVEKYTP